MNHKLFILVATLFTTCFLVTVRASAEAPCTYLSHDRIEDIRACLTTYNRSQYLNNHHIQMMNSLANDNSIPRHPYPYIGNDAFFTSMLMAEGLVYGMRYGRAVFPLTWYIYNYPYFFP